MIGRKITKRYHNLCALTHKSMQRTADIIKSRGEQKTYKEVTNGAGSEETARRTLEDCENSFNPEQRHVCRITRRVTPPHTNK